VHPDGAHKDITGGPKGSHLHVATWKQVEAVLDRQCSHGYAVEVDELGGDWSGEDALVDHGNMHPATRGDTVAD
jgi:hypothetical protein